jgi:hypothetical protein
LFAMPSRRCRIPATRGTWSAEAIFEIPIRTGEAIIDLVDGNSENYYLNRCSLPRLKSREARQAGLFIGEISERYWHARTPKSFLLNSLFPAL